MVPVNSEKQSGFVKLGCSKFVLLFGVLGWGVPTGILFALIQAYREGWDGFLPKLAIALVIFPLGGILWGRVMWWMMQRQREKAAANAVKT
jgi:hypothetical protein